MKDIHYTKASTIPLAFTWEVWTLWREREREREREVNDQIDLCFSLILNRSCSSPPCASSDMAPHNTPPSKETASRRWRWRLRAQHTVSSQPRSEQQTDRDWAGATAPIGTRNGNLWWECDHAGSSQAPSITINPVCHGGTRCTLLAQHNQLQLAILLSSRHACLFLTSSLTPLMTKF